MGLIFERWNGFINYSGSVINILKFLCYSAPDSGFFLDIDPFTDEFETFHKYYIESFMEITNNETDPPNRKCVKDYQDEKWKCLMAQYLINYIDIPIFIV